MLLLTATLSACYAHKVETTKADTGAEVEDWQATIAEEWSALEDEVLSNTADADIRFDEPNAIASAFLLTHPDTALEWWDTFTTDSDDSGKAADECPAIEGDIYDMTATGGCTTPDGLRIEGSYRFRTDGLSLLMEADHYVVTSELGGSSFDGRFAVLGMDMNVSYLLDYAVVVVPASEIPFSIEGSLQLVGAGVLGGPVTEWEGLVTTAEGLGRVDGGDLAYRQYEDCSREPNAGGIGVSGAQYLNFDFEGDQCDLCLDYTLDEVDGTDCSLSEHFDRGTGSQSE